MAIIFRQNCEKNIFHNNYEPHGTLQRIRRIRSDPPETQHPVQNRPWVPHAGGQDDGSLHKLPQIIPYLILMYTHINNLHTLNSEFFVYKLDMLAFL